MFYFLSFFFFFSLWEITNCYWQGCPNTVYLKKSHRVSIGSEVRHSYSSTVWSCPKTVLGVLMAFYISLISINIRICLWCHCREITDSAENRGDPWGLHYFTPNFCHLSPSTVHYGGWFPQIGTAQECGGCLILQSGRDQASYFTSVSFKFCWSTYPDTSGAFPLCARFVCVFSWEFCQSSKCNFESS